MPTNSPRPFQLTYPLNARQVEEIDSMFQRLFSKLPLGVERGGTGLGFGAFQIGNLFYGDEDAQNKPIISTLAAGVVGTYLRSGGLLTAPVWSTLTLVNTVAVGDILIGSALNDVTGLAIGGAGTILRSTGTLPAWSGFTIPNTFAQGDVPYASATNVISALAKDTNATRYLSNTGASNAPVWAQVSMTNGVTGTLAETQGGTGQATWTAGSIVYASATNDLTGLPIGGSGAFVRSNGSIPFWSTLTIPNTATTGGIFHASATSVGTFLAIGTVGKILRTSGTLPEWSTFTIPNTYVLGDTLYTSAANVLTALAGNITTTQKVLAQTGDGAVSAAPSWVPMPTPGAAGTDTQVQFNDGGTNLGGDAGLVYNKTTDALTMGSGVLTLGQLVFPATQNASSNVNTLDDYEEGSWTPTYTFSTPGNVNVVYVDQTAEYVKIGKVVICWMSLASTITHTTAAGTLVISGLPFTVDGTRRGGAMAFQGVTKANYTQIVFRPIMTGATMDLDCSGSAQARNAIVAADVPTGGSPQFLGQFTYFSAT